VGSINDKPGSLTVTARISRSFQTPRNLPLSWRILLELFLELLGGFFSKNSASSVIAVLLLHGRIAAPTEQRPPKRGSCETLSEKLSRLLRRILPPAHRK